MRTPIPTVRYSVVPILLVFAVSPSGVAAAPWVTFTEILYHPAGDEALEFVEIYNLAAPHVDLTGWRLDGEIEFEFPRGDRLAPGKCVVVARDPAALGERYPGVENVVGPYRGDLDNESGRLTLWNGAGAVAAEMRYGSGGEWSAVPDGAGHTLVLADSFFDARAPGSWKPSAVPGGTPGDHFLSDDPERLTKWRIPTGVTVPPEFFAVLSRGQLGADSRSVRRAEGSRSRRSIETAMKSGVRRSWSRLGSDHASGARDKTDLSEPVNRVLRELLTRV